eukprot:363579-Chlamydomonas_euryale.AAC.5
MAGWARSGKMARRHLRRRRQRARWRGGRAAGNGAQTPETSAAAGETAGMVRGGKMARRHLRRQRERVRWRGGRAAGCSARTHFRQGRQRGAAAGDMVRWVHSTGKDSSLDGGLGGRLTPELSPWGRVSSWTDSLGRSLDEALGIGSPLDRIIKLRSLCPRLQSSRSSHLREVGNREVRAPRRRRGRAKVGPEVPAIYGSWWRQLVAVGGVGRRWVTADGARQWLSAVRGHRPTAGKGNGGC